MGQNRRAIHPVWDPESPRSIRTATTNYEEDEMSLRKTFSVTIVAMALFAAASAAAKPKDSKNLLLRYDATVAGSHLASGDYNVTYQTHSPQATVTFYQKGKVVATADGKVVDHGRKFQANEVVYGLDGNGARQIQQIRFKGSSEVIEFE